MSEKHTSITIASILLIPFCISLADTTWVAGGNISGVWDSSGSPYMIEGDITVDSTDTLFIEPGVTVYFTAYYKLMVYGLLQANGSESDSIFFVTDSLTNPDLWGGIRFEDAHDSCRIEYCVIQWAKSNSSNPGGGGICCINSHLKLSHSTFRENSASYPNLQGRGGAVSFEGSTATLQNCYFESNYAAQSGGAVACVNSSINFNFCHITDNSCLTGSIVGAGAVLVYFGADATFEECIFARNFGHVAGAVGIVWSSHASFSHCSFRENRESAVFCDSYDSWATFSDCEFIGNSGTYGGAISYASPYGTREITMERCTFIGNHSPWGAIFCQAGFITLDSCRFIDNTGGAAKFYAAQGLFTNCTFTGNSAAHGAAVLAFGNVDFSKCTFDSNSADYGGALKLHETSFIDRCTFSGNRAEEQGGAIYVSNGTFLHLTSTIITHTASGEGIYFHHDNDTDVSYCDFFGNEDGTFGGSLPPSLGQIVTTNANSDSCDAFYNIFLDPLFADTGESDFGLLAGSPCIDAGDPALPYDPDNTVADIGAFFFDQSDVSDIRLPIPQNFALYQNYPNPFNMSTSIQYQIAHRGHVSLTIYNILGEKIVTLLDDIQNPGCYSIIFNGDDLASGIYFYTLHTEGFSQTHRMILVK